VIDYFNGAVDEISTEKLLTFSDKFPAKLLEYYSIRCYGHGTETSPLPSILMVQLRYRNLKA
jgi:hypothetical protein